MTRAEKEAERYRRLAEAAERVERIRARFTALGIEVGSRVAALDLSFEAAEEILDRLEGRAPPAAGPPMPWWAEGSNYSPNE